jgi:hypothetical protein
LVRQFEALAALIRATGTARPWPPPPQRAIYHNRYLEIGPNSYWAMGNDGDRGPIAEINVMNRTRIV